MSSPNFLSSHLSEKTSIFGLRLWVVLGIGVGAFIVLVLVLLAIWLLATSKSNSSTEKVSSSSSGMIPTVCKDIKEVVVQVQDTKSLKHSNSNRSFSSITRKGHILSTGDISDAENEVVTFGFADTSAPDGVKIVKGRSDSQNNRGLMQNHGSFNGSHHSRKDRNFETPKPPVVNLEDVEKRGLLVNSSDKTFSALSGSGVWDSADSPGAFMVTFTTSLPEGLPLSWGFRYTLRDLQLATNHFSESNVLGKGGYGIVYQGCLPDRSFIAVKNLLNNRGQAEREFRIEVEIIGRVRHKNLVRLLGYCAEGSYRMLVYEYVNNGNLQQWLHGALGEKNPIPWEGRMKIVLETAKGLAYLHEDLDPKIIHRDVKSSNILLDNNWNVKISDFGLAKFIGSGMTHVMTRVMGTFGYVAPEYASTGMLTEKSDVYSFGVLMMELITGKDPVDYGRPTGEVNLVDWMKVMIGNRRSEEVVDPRLPVKPSARALKRALLVALRCVDPDAEKRPKMGHVIHMLEADDFPIRTVVKQQNTPRER